jgi:flagellar motor switch protein FliN/FliY
MVEATVPAVAAVAGIPVQAGPPVTVSPAQAIATSGSMMNRSQFTSGAGSGSLLTIVPAGGLITASGAVDAVTLAGALAAGAADGIVAGGGPLFQVSPPSLVASSAGLDVSGAEAVVFDLLAGGRKVPVILIVEATLGSLVGGSLPVEEPAVREPRVAAAQLPSLDRAGVVPADRSIETLSDVVTRFSVEIARGTVHVRDLVSMRPGSVFELDREAGDAVDVLVNGTMVARGDIVVVGKQLGVRITKIYGGG